MNIKKIIIRSLIGALILIGIVIIIFSIYLIKVYIEFNANKESIFSKINDFSLALGKNSESDITLGLDTTDDSVSDREPSLILDKKNNIIAKYSEQKHKLILLKELPYYLSNGFIMVEDKEFFNHHGLNYFRLVNAVFRNIFSMGKSGGGSTISQQLAKILFTKQERKLKRKIYELYCTMELEKRFTKNELLQIYLNSIYLGHGTYGIESAASFYFGKNASELTIAEASLLIGMNRSPENYSPIKYKENAKKIQTIVLNQFVKNGIVSKEESEREMQKFWKEFTESGISGNQSFWRTEINNSAYVTEYVRQILEEEFDYEKVTQGGLIVETTIDLEKQNIAEKVIKNDLKYIKSKVPAFIEERKIKDYDMSLIDQIEAAFISMDYKTGEVQVIVGGSNYSYANQFNRAINAHRHIGSSVKPLLYSFALNKGKLGDKEINPFSKFKDELITYKINGKNYTPRNYHYNHKYGDIVTLYDAQKKSLNTVAIQVLNQLDIKEFADYVRKITFTPSNEKERVPEVLSLGLGTCELSPLELATAYSIFPRGGKTIYPIIIKKIYDKKGNVYYDGNRMENPYFSFIHPVPDQSDDPVIRPEVSYEEVQMLRSVFEKGGTAYYSAFRTGFNGNGYGKSGTSQDYKDAWFAGFSDNEVAVAWVGLDNNQSIILSSESTSAVIWCDYMSKVSGKIADPIDRPANMVLAPVCTQTGLLAGTGCPEKKDFYFWKEGPLPEKCYIHNLNENMLEIEE